MIHCLARYILSHDGAEFALAVTDDWCQGIDRLLLERLDRRAAAEGVNRLRRGVARKRACCG